MALYAFDGTCNEDDTNEEKGVSEDTNVCDFREAYIVKTEYLAGVGTRLGGLGRFFGGVFGAGGQTRIEEMYAFLETNWSNNDKTIDIIGFSRGAALAVHFANVIEKNGIKEGDKNRFPKNSVSGIVGYRRLFRYSKGYRIQFPEN